MNPSTPSNSGEHIQVISSMENFIKECEKNVGTLAPEVRNKVMQLLQEEIPLLTGRLATIEKSTTPEIEMIDYMTSILRLFFKSIATIDPESKQIQAFWTMYLNINQSFIYTMKQLSVFSTKTFEEKKEMIRKAVIAAAK